MSAQAPFATIHSTGQAALPPSMRRRERFNGSRGANGPVDSSPAVASGVVYVGSDDNYLYSLDAITGQILWHTLTGGAIDSSPTIVNDIIYVGSDDNYLYALDATTGQILVKTATAGT